MSQPLTAPAILLALPHTVRVLDIGIACGGTVLEALLHCRQLEQLLITGNAASVLWTGPGANGLLPKLRSLRLDYRRAADLGEGPSLHLESDFVEPRALALVQATQLTHLSLSGAWNEVMSSLCGALPALQSLR